MARAVTLWIALTALPLLPNAAHSLGPAQPFTEPLAAARAADMATARASDAAKSLAARPIPSGLTGVRLGTSPGALIDGLWIALGQPVRDARLVGVRAQDVLLRRADGRVERLALFPATPPSSAAPIADAGADATAPPDPLLAKRDLP